MLINFSEQGSGDPVILLHGMFGSLSNLGNLARHLSSDFRVISVDLRNHGESPHHQVMDLPSMAADIVALMDALDMDTAALVGHSLGGKVAMQAAMDEPHRVANVVVADISPVTYAPRQDAALDGLTALHQADIQDRREADEIMARYVSEPQVRAFLLKNLSRSDDGHYKLRLNMASILQNYGTSLVAAPAGQPYKGQALFIKGELSAYIQTKHGVTIERMFPNNRRATIEGVGHWLHAEKPQEFNALVAEFLQSH